MNILVLTCKLGMGHYSAASTLVEDLKKEFPDSNICLKDLIDETLPKLSDTVYDTYSLFVNKGSKIYNMLYKKTETKEKHLKIPFENHFLAGLHQLIYETKADAVISTLSFCSQLVSEYKDRYRKNIPFATCVTDVTAHKGWINPNTDLYLVASEFTKQGLLQKGVDESMIYVIGMPVKEQFKKIHRASLGKEKHLLIMGGGLGLMPKDKTFYKEINQIPNVKTTVIAGSNTSLYNKLHGKYENIEVIGYTDKVYEYMQWADLIVSKPGGVTLFETIYSELPILVLCPFLEQETKNARFIEQFGLGKVFWKMPEDPVLAIQMTLEDDRALTDMGDHMRVMKHSIERNVVGKAVSCLKARQGISA